MSIQALENAAREGDAQAQLQLGIALMTGQGVPAPDVDRGRDWLARSADGGNADAQRFLGMIYLRGMDVVPDYGKAVDCLQSAAASGDADSAWWLAGYLGGARDEAFDPERALKLLRVPPSVPVDSGQVRTQVFNVS